MNKKLITTSVAALLSATPTFAEIQTDIGNASIDFRLRYESVNQDNQLKDASALTLRTKANFKTITKQGFYGFVELENSFALLDDYNDTNGNGSEFSVVADPQTTELDQAYIGYKTDNLDVKVGRQVITLDNHRFVGHVGWRQDKQTFDALSVGFNASEKLKLSYSYITKRNRIFAEDKDLDSKDHLLNATFMTDVGKLTGYAYLLEVDNGTDNAIDTYGARFDGKASGFSYAVEYATQTTEAGMTEFDTSYFLIKGGTQLGKVNLGLGFESLGSDDGLMGFATPLATLHKFNGWSDQFLGTPSVGLNDLFVTASGKVANGKWSTALHSYSAAESNDTIDDLGSEINLSYTTKLANKFPVGVKYASYFAGDIKTDTSKLWLWTGYTF